MLFTGLCAGAITLGMFFVDGRLNKILKVLKEIRDGK